MAKNAIPDGTALASPHQRRRVADKPVTKAQLQERAEELGLPTSGTKAALAKRIDEHTRSTAGDGAGGSPAGVTAPTVSGDTPTP